MKSFKPKLFLLTISLLAIALGVYLYLNLFYQRSGYEMLFGFPYLGEEDVRYSSAHDYEKWPLPCRSNELNIERGDGFTVYYYCTVKRFVIELPVKNLSESKLLQAFPYPALTSPQVYLINRFVLGTNFTLPPDAVIGIYRHKSFYSSSYFFSIRFGLPYCFKVNATPHNITLIFEHYAIINGKRFGGSRHMYTGYWEQCLDPFWSLFVSISEKMLRGEYDEVLRELKPNYEVLRGLRPGENITVEFIIEFYMSREQAESSRGYIEITFAYPYTAVQYPQKHS
jgi:hypothetical protein